MKIGLFTDTHYCDAESLGTRRPSLSYGKVKIAMDQFKAQGVDIVFCLGDLVDCPDGLTREDTLRSLRKILDLIESYEIPFYMVPGNHDYIALTGADFEAHGLKTPPYVVENDDFRFIVLDANYRSSMERFDIAGVEWTDSNLPKEQIEYLKSALETGKACIVLVHENLDPTICESHRVNNAEEVREVIKNSANVKMVLQGHYHKGKEGIFDEIPYLAVPAMCEGDGAPFKIIEL